MKDQHMKPKDEDDSSKIQFGWRPIKLDLKGDAFLYYNVSTAWIYPDTRMGASGFH